MRHKFFPPSEKHVAGKKWPSCRCMTCASDYEDQLVAQDQELWD